MKSLLCLFFFLTASLLVAAKEISFMPCADSPLVLKRVTLFPYPLKSGDMGAITVTGVLNMTVLGGAYSLEFFPDPSEALPQEARSGHLCDLIPCPSAAGDVTFVLHANVPRGIKSDTYIVRATAIDQDEKQLLCVVVAIDISNEDDDKTEGTIFADKRDMWEQLHHEV